MTRRPLLLAALAWAGVILASSALHAPSWLVTGLLPGLAVVMLFAHDDRGRHARATSARPCPRPPRSIV